MAIDAQAQEYFGRHRRVREQKPVQPRIYEGEYFARLLRFPGDRRCLRVFLVLGQCVSGAA